MKRNLLLIFFLIRIVSICAQEFKLDYTFRLEHTKLSDICSNKNNYRLIAVLESGKKVTLKTFGPKTYFANINVTEKFIYKDSDKIDYIQFTSYVNDENDWGGCHSGNYSDVKFQIDKHPCFDGSKSSFMNKNLRTIHSFLGYTITPVTKLSFTDGSPVNRSKIICKNEGVEIETIGGFYWGYRNQIHRWEYLDPVNTTTVETEAYKRVRNNFSNASKRYQECEARVGDGDGVPILQRGQSTSSNATSPVSRSSPVEIKVSPQCRYLYNLYLDALDKLVNFKGPKTRPEQLWRPLTSQNGLNPVGRSKIKLFLKDIYPKTEDQSKALNNKIIYIRMNPSCSGEKDVSNELRIQFLPEAPQVATRKPEFDSPKCSYDEIEGFTLFFKRQIKTSETVNISLKRYDDLTRKYLLQSQNPGVRSFEPVPGSPDLYKYVWKKEDPIIDGKYKIFVSSTIDGIRPEDLLAGCKELVFGPYDISTPDPVVFEDLTVVQDEKCYREKNGILKVKASGGSGTYKVFLNGTITSPSSTSKVGGITELTFNNLAPRSYQVKVRDSNDCEVRNTNGDEITKTETITAKADIRHTVSSTDVVHPSAPRLSNATINIRGISGGTPKYKYVVLLNGTTPSRTISGEFNTGGGLVENLPAGKHKIQYTDKNKCVRVLDLPTITDPTPIKFTVRTENPNCNGAKGKIKVSGISGGYGTYNVIIFKQGSTSELTRENDVTSAEFVLDPGNYTVKVEDRRKGSTTKNEEIARISKMIVNATFIPIKCYGDKAKVTLTVKGGRSRIQYQYAQYKSSGTLVWQNSNVFNVVASRTPYQFLVRNKDLHSCQSERSASVTIKQPEEFYIETPNVKHNDVFGGKKGSIALTIKGGTPPASGYTVAWTKKDDRTFSATGAFIDKLEAGIYKAIIRDRFCSIEREVEVKENPKLEITSLKVVTPIKCHGEKGRIEAIVKGGSKTYTYQWKRGTSVISGANKLFLEATADDYTFIVNDGFTSTDMKIKLPGKSKIEVTVTKEDITCNTLNDGKIKLTIKGGTAPYQFSTNGKNGTYKSVNTLTNNTIQNLTNRNYTVWIKDKLGCTISAKPVTIIKPSKIAVINNVIKDNEVRRQSIGAITIKVDGGSGRYNYLWTSDKDANFKKTTPNLTQLPAAKYTVKISDVKNANCFITETFEVREPLPLSVTVKQTDFIYCYGENTATLLAEVEGGYPLNATPSDFTYTWYKINGTTTSRISTPNPKSDEITTLIAGVYKVEVEDEKGTKATSTNVTIKQPDPLVITLKDANDVSCFKGNDGFLSVDVKGGNNDYSFVWKKEGEPSFSVNTNKLSEITGLKEGNYYVEVTDGICDPIKSKTFKIEEPSSLPKIDVANTTHVTGFGKKNGSIKIEVSGGASTTYSYEWRLQGETNIYSTNKDLIDIPAGTYQLTLINDKCTVTSNLYVVNQPDKLVIDDLKQSGEIKCFGDKTKTLTVNASGGIDTFPYTYSWKLIGDDTALGDNTNVLKNVGAGIYRITITDKNSNSVYKDIEVKQPPLLQLLTKDISKKDVSCHGGNDGYIKIEATGGTGAYSYTWSHGSGITGNELKNLEARTYEVTIRDEKFCEFTTTIKIEQPDRPLVIKDSKVEDTKGYDLKNGSIRVDVDGGTTPYTYTWKDASGVVVSPRSTTNIQTDLKAGLYSLEIVDAKGCTITPIPKFEVKQPDPLSIIFKKKEILCFGEKGAISAEVNGGVKPYRYSWKLKGEATTLSTTAELPNRSGGTYVLSILDKYDNALSKEVFLFEPPVLELLDKDVTVKNVSCHGGNDGEIKVAASGGVGGYSYVWDDGKGSTGDELKDLKAGVYEVTVRDSNLRCVITKEITITEPEHELIIQNDQVVDVTRNGLGNGSITITVFGGTKPYTYEWKDASNVVLPSTTNVQANLKAGMYTVSVIDAKGCTITPIPKFEVKQPDPLKITFDKKDVNCHGEKVTVKAEVTGGVKPYRYSWKLEGETTELSTTAELPNRGGGTYVLSVLDKNDNPVQDKVIVFEPSKLEIDNIATTNITCYEGKDGAIKVSVKGGTTPYTYKWRHTGLDTNDLKGLPSGVYYLEIEDAKGCTIETGAISLTQPVLYDITKVKLVRPSSDITTDGNIEVFITGGEAPYRYLWKDEKGDVISDITKNEKEDKIVNLGEGKYNLTITDAKDCAIIEDYNLANPGELLVEIQQTQEITCFGSSTAVLDVITVGGVGGNEYKWYDASDDSLIRETKELRDVPIGKYYIIVSNAEGIEEQSAVFEVKQPEEIKLTIDPTDLSCHNTTDGSFTLDVKGGLGAYEFRYKGGAVTTFSDWIKIGANTADVKDLLNGKYTIQLRDKENCFAKNTEGDINFEIEILKPSIVEIDKETVTHVSGFGKSNGSVVINVIGGSTLYTYVWTDVHGNEKSYTNSLDGVTAGTYKVTIKDSKGCPLVKEYVIEQPKALEVDVDVASVISCIGDKDGAVEAFVKGGVEPYTYKWYEEGSTTVLGTDAKLSTIGDGKYYVDIVDANLNTKTSAVIPLVEPKALELTLSSEYTLCGTGNDWTITTEVKGGTAPYRYLWNTRDNTPGLNGVISGDYNVLIVDKNGCSISKSITLIPPPTLEIDNETITHVTGFDLSNGGVTITNIGGTPPYTYEWIDTTGSPVSSTTSITNVKAGKYTLTINDSKGCTITKAYTIEQPLKLEVTPSVSRIISCKGEKDGVLEAIVKGGVQPYTYAWYQEGNTNVLGNEKQLANLGDGTYYVEIVDANLNIVTSTTFIFSEPEVLEVSLSADYTLCATGNDWTITTEVKGGTAPYRYLWGTGATSAVLDNMISGRYDVLVIDANGCRANTSITVTPPPTLTIDDAIITNPTCYKGDDGKIELAVKGGTPPYTYDWNTTATTRTIEGLVSGVYQVTIVDSKGCQIVGSFNVKDPEQIPLDLGVDVTLCEGQTYVIDGTIPDGAEYIWTSSNGFSSTDSVIEVAEEGIYKLVATNSDGCKVQDEIEIKRSKEIVSSDFIISSIAFVNEPFAAVNVSSPVPDEVEWILPSEAKINEENKEYVELYFEEEGEFEITLFTKKGNCESFLTKKVIVIEQEITEETEGEETAKAPMIKDFVIYPNPSSGIFTLELKLKEISDASVKIYSLLSNDLMDYKKVENQEVYTIDYNLSLVPGIYFVLLETQGEKLVKKIIIQ